MPDLYAVKAEAWDGKTWFVAITANSYAVDDELPANRVAAMLNKDKFDYVKNHSIISARVVRVRLEVVE